MQFEEIKQLIKRECKIHNVQFKHGRGKTVRFKTGILSNGYFYEGDEASPPVLAIATNSNSLDTLVHEYCHMNQCIENVKVWKDLTDSDQIWHWIGGAEGYTEDVLDNSMLVYYNVELDCEKRAVERHKEWQTDTDLTEYIQKANAYTMFYFFMRDHRVWYAAGREPYSLKEVWSQMPKTFDFDRVDTYTKIHTLFHKCI